MDGNAAILAQLFYILNTVALHTADPHGRSAIADNAALNAEAADRSARPRTIVP